MNELHVPGKSLKSFVLTQEFNRFEEFASSCIDFRYIGVCYGEPGVGKSLAAARFTQWQEELIGENAVDELSAKRKKKLKIVRVPFLLHR